MANGPPIIIPKVPVKNIINAFHPKLKIALRSILNVISTRAAGKRNLLATKYRLLDSTTISPELFNTSHSGAIHPKVVNKAGNIYATKRPGTIL